MHENFNNNPGYFNNPKQAVEIIKELLLAEEWETLARYYDLSNTDISFERLQSGEYFLNDKEPEIKHPSSQWRYKNPFEPGFVYNGFKEAGENVIEVCVKKEIDVGDDILQVGLHFFKMIKKEKGLQLIPS